MARPKRATVGSKYVATAALTEVLKPLIDQSGPSDDAVVESPAAIAEHLVTSAWDVEHFPVANKVTITLDLAALDKPAGGA